MTLSTNDAMELHTEKRASDIVMKDDKQYGNEGSSQRITLVRGGPVDLVFL